MTGGRGGNVVLGSSVPTEFPRDVPRQEINREQVIDPAQPTVALQRRQVRVGHLRAQRGETIGGHLTILHDLRGELEKPLGEQLTARNPDLKLALESED